MDSAYTDINFSDMAFLFATIENMDSCSINITDSDGDTSGIVMEREEVEGALGGGLYVYSESPKKLKMLNAKIADYVDFLGDLRSNTSQFMKNRLQKVTLAELKKVTATPEDAGYENGICILAALPKEDITVYGYPEGRGVILRKGDSLSYFDISYSNPQSFPTRLQYYDYDKDGENEIALDVYRGGGTGLSIEQLYILEKADSDAWIPHQFTADDYTAQIRDRVTYKVNKKANTIALFSGQKKLQEADLTWLKGDEVKDVHYGDIVSFDIEDGLSISIAPGLQVGDRASLQYEGLNALRATVQYEKDGTFTIKTIR